MREVGGSISSSPIHDTAPPGRSQAGRCRSRTRGAVFGSSSEGRYAYAGGGHRCRMICSIQHLHSSGATGELGMYDIAVRTALFALVRTRVRTVKLHAAEMRREAAHVSAAAHSTREEARANLAQLRQRVR